MRKSHEELHQVKIDGKNIELTPIEYSLLKTFLSHPGKVFSRSDLILQVQGYYFEGYERTIDSHIKNLRKKLAEFFPNQSIILSVYGIGYKIGDLTYLKKNLH